LADLREDPRKASLRALRRRVLLGTLAVLALFFAFWRAWDLELRLFWELLIGSILLVAVMAVVGAAMAALWAWLRRRRQDGNE